MSMLRVVLLCNLYSHSISGGWLAIFIPQEFVDLNNAKHFELHHQLFFMVIHT